ncbi:hypothetical protein bcere0005_56940 [Bacillus cereus 172560W]|nr:hypothetical protein bcere0005_56940 [Bacillus cereus 172560W]QDD84754.1 hypothetical protein FORC087_3463 [Bacillus cereus]
MRSLNPVPGPVFITGSLFILFTFIYFYWLIKVNTQPISIKIV